MPAVLKAHWKCDEASGPILDSVGGFHLSAPVGISSPLSVDGGPVSGRARGFRRSNPLSSATPEMYAQCDADAPLIAAMSGPMSRTYWVKSQLTAMPAQTGASPPNFQVLVTVGGRTGAGASEGAITEALWAATPFIRQFYDLWNRQVGASTRVMNSLVNKHDVPVPDTAWHHVAHVRRQVGAELEIDTYLDGTFLRTATSVSSGAPWPYEPPNVGAVGTTRVCLGALPNGATFGQAHADLCDVRLYEGVLTADEVFALYMMGNKPPSAMATLESTHETDFGFDISTVPDLDACMSAAYGQRLVAEAVAKRLVTPRGGLAFHPTYGFDVRAFLSESMTPARLAEAKARVEAEAEADDRVEAARAELSFTDGTTLRIRLQLATAEGPFAFTLTVDALHATLTQE